MNILDEGVTGRITDSSYGVCSETIVGEHGLFGEWIKASGEKGFQHDH